MHKKNTSPTKEKRFSKNSKLSNSWQVAGWPVAVFDIETSELKANLGVIISAGVKTLGRKPVVFVNKNLGHDGLNDKEICLALRDELESKGILVGFYSLGFDLKMINSRLMYWGYPPLKPKLHIDLYRLGKRYFNTSRRNLDTICAHLGIPGKTHIDLQYWLQAKINGDKDAVRYIVQHMVADLKITEKLFYRLKDLIKSISLC